MNWKEITYHDKNTGEYIHTRCCHYCPEFPSPEWNLKKKSFFSLFLLFFLNFLPWTEFFADGGRRGCKNTLNCENIITRYKVTDHGISWLVSVF